MRGRIMVLFESHTSTCEVNKYSQHATCPVIHLLKSLDQVELWNLLPILSHLPTSHQEVAVSCINAYAPLKRELLQRLCTFCTQEGVESQVVSPAIEHVILSYTRHGVGDCDLMEFFTRLLTDFSLPPSVASDEEIGVWMRRYKRENMLINFSDQIGSAVVNMPFHAEGLNSLLFIGLLTAFQDGEGDFDLHKKAALLRVLARGFQEKKFFTATLLGGATDDGDNIAWSDDTTWVVTGSPTSPTWSDNPDGIPWHDSTPVEDDATSLDALLDGFSRSLLTYFRDIVPLVEGEDKKDNVVQKLIYPIFVIMVYSKEVLSKVKKEAESNSLLELLSNWSEEFAETPDVGRRPKESHVSIPYVKKVDALTKEIRKVTRQRKRRRLRLS